MPHRSGAWLLGVRFAEREFDGIPTLPYQSQKPVWWKITVGVLLIYTEVSQFFPGDLASSLLRAPHSFLPIEINALMVILIAVGCWLVYSGIKPAPRKTE